MAKPGLSTWIHHLADALSAGRLYVAGNAPYRAKVVKAAADIGPDFLRQPLYVLQHDPAAFVNESLISHAERTWSGLPYPTLLLEFARTDLADPLSGREDLVDRVILRAFEMSDGTVGVNMFSTDHDPRYWVADYGYATFGPNDLKERTCEITLSAGIMSEPDIIRTDTEIALSEAVSILLAFIGLLHSPAIGRETVQPDKDANRLRRLRKKAPVPTYTAVTLVLPKAAPGGGGGGGGQRSSPRCHWRSGHDRHYPSGRVAHIPPTLVAWHGEEEPPPPKYNVKLREPT